MKVLIDTNVVLDLLLVRAPFEAEAKQIWDALAEGRITGYITASAFTDIFYIARKQTDKETARRIVQTCFGSLGICAVDRQTIQQSLLLSGSDFEDDLQQICALIYGLDAIVTRDKAGFKGSSIPALTPSELLAQLAASS